MQTAKDPRPERPSEEWILTSFNKHHHTLHTGPPDLLSRTQGHLSKILQTSLRKAAGASHEVWRKSKCKCYHFIQNSISRQYHNYYFILYIFQSGYINGDALQRSFLEFSYASFEADQLWCGAPFTCPA